jgi:hypothetical protein
VIAGKVLNLDSSQHRLAFACNGNSAHEFADALVIAGIRLGTPATALSDGDAGLWKWQRQVLAEARLALNWSQFALALSAPCRRRVHGAVIAGRQISHLVE